MQTDAAYVHTAMRILPGWIHIRQRRTPHADTALEGTGKAASARPVSRAGASLTRHTKALLLKIPLLGELGVRPE